MGCWTLLAAQHERLTCQQAPEGAPPSVCAAQRPRAGLERQHKLSAVTKTGHSQHTWRGGRTVVGVARFARVARARPRAARPGGRRGPGARASRAAAVAAQRRARTKALRAAQLGGPVLAPVW